MDKARKLASKAYNTGEHNEDITRTGVAAGELHRSFDRGYRDSGVVAESNVVVAAHRFPILRARIYYFYSVDKALFGHTTLPLEHNRGRTRSVQNRSGFGMFSCEKSTWEIVSTPLMHRASRLVA